MEMQNEMVSSPWEDFHRHYLPFRPTDADVDDCVAHLETKHFLVRHDKQQDVAE